MNRRRFALLVGVGIGALGLVLARKLRERDHELSADSLAESLRDQLATLEAKIERIRSHRA